MTFNSFGVNFQLLKIIPTSNLARARPPPCSAPWPAVRRPAIRFSRQHSERLSQRRGNGRRRARDRQPADNRHQQAEGRRAHRSKTGLHHLDHHRDQYLAARLPFSTWARNCGCAPLSPPDGLIRMEVHPELSSGTVEVQSGMTIPNESVTQVTTNVMVRDGLHGGHRRPDARRVDTTASEIPLLGALPVVGPLFRQSKEPLSRSGNHHLAHAAHHLRAGERPRRRGRPPAISIAGMPCMRKDELVRPPLDRPPLLPHGAKRLGRRRPADRLAICGNGRAIRSAQSRRNRPAQQHLAGPALRPVYVSQGPQRRAPAGQSANRRLVAGTTSNKNRWCNSRRSSRWIAGRRAGTKTSCARGPCNERRSCTRKDEATPFQGVPPCCVLGMPRPCWPWPSLAVRRGKNLLPKNFRPKWRKNARTATPRRSAIFEIRPFHGRIQGGREPLHRRRHVGCRKCSNTSCRRNPNHRDGRPADDRNLPGRQ